MNASYASEQCSQQQRCHTCQVPESPRSRPEPTGQPGVASAAEKNARGQRRRRRRADLARSEILEAALDIARETSWQAVTMRAIADRLDASPAYAYRYFPSRDAILLALVHDGFDHLLEAMRAAAAALTDPADQLRAAKRAYVAFALAEPELYQAMYGLGGVHLPAEQTRADGVAVGQLDAQLLSNLTGRPPEEHTDDVLVLWAAVHGLLALAAAGRIDQPIDQPGGLVDRLLDDTLARVEPTPTRRSSRAKALP